MLSAVIPVFNEVESLELLHEELAAVAREQRYDLEVIFVDDGSTDGSWQAIRRLAARDPRVRGLRFRRNFGKAAALAAGFSVARGELVMTLDADLQDDPHEFPRFLAAMSDGVDLVSGWKRIRHDPWHKVFPSRVFNWLVSWLTSVHLHDHNCGMKCYRATVCRELRLYGEMHRFVPVLAAARGFRVGEITIHHRPRRFGHSKYGLRRFVKGFLDLLTVKFLTVFGERPMHLLGTLGLAALLAGGAGLAYLAGDALFRHFHAVLDLPPLHGLPVLLYSLSAVLLGVQLLATGFVAELVAAHAARHSVRYSIAETAGDGDAAHLDDPPAQEHSTLAR